ncbi:hypothetical protein PCAR4_830055 [Paraburkholderia caribensis]|nr:hypothetical protein PCAR4_830055 [Paraburkholderia caribensis]
MRRSFVVIFSLPVYFLYVNFQVPGGTLAQRAFAHLTRSNRTMTTAKFHRNQALTVTKIKVA